MEQPLPMSPSLASDQFPGPGADIKPPLGLDMAGGFNMAKAMSESAGSFMSGMEMTRVSQEMMGSAPHQDYGGQILIFLNMDVSMNELKECVTAEVRCQTR